MSRSAVLLDEFVVNAATRRQFLAILAASGLVAGCGRATDDAQRPRSAGYPRTVEHAGGSTTLESQPQRLYVPTNGISFDVVLALGIVPAGWGVSGGAEQALYSWQAVAEESTRIDASGFGSGANVEEMLGAGIDLIVMTQTDYTTFPEIDTYRSVAPIVVIPDANYAEQLRIIGESAGLAPEVSQQRADDVEQLITGFRPPSTPRSISVISYYGEANIYVNTDGSAVGQMIERVGLPALGRIGAADPTRDDIRLLSLERLGEADADLVIAIGSFTGEASPLDDLETSPVFQNLSAVREGRYRRVDGEEALAFVIPTVMSLPVALGALSEVLA